MPASDIHPRGTFAQIRYRRFFAGGLGIFNGSFFLGSGLEPYESSGLFWMPAEIGSLGNELPQQNRAFGGIRCASKTELEGSSQLQLIIQCQLIIQLHLIIQGHLIL